MELKRCKFFGAYALDELLIVLNGIETNSIYFANGFVYFLLIVLNGIETLEAAAHKYTRFTFNRTKWN